MAEKIVLVDGYSLMYRAFHALPILDNGEGVYTNAVFGFMNMLLKVLSEEQPDYLAVAFDEHEKTFRHIHYDAYKAGRAPTPEELRPQIPLICEMLELMGVRQISLKGFEADDLLGTISQMCEEKKIDCVIVTGDRDAYQLAGEYTTILYTKRGITENERVTPEWIKEKYQVAPVQMIDIKGLMGDASDNIPGVPGVGEKTAIKLITQFGSLENALDKADTELKGAVRTRLMENREQAIDSKFLATIVRNAPLDFDFESAKIKSFQPVIPLMRKLKLRSLVDRVMKFTGDGENAQEETGGILEKEKKALLTLEGEDALRKTVSDIIASGAKLVSAYVGEKFSLATDLGDRFQMNMDGDLLSPGVEVSRILDAMKAFASQERARVIFHNIKAFEGEIDVFKNVSEDAMLASYVINPHRTARTLEENCAFFELEFSRECPAESLLSLFALESEKMRADGVFELYREIELPLAFVLRDMEDAGFRVDKEYLGRLGKIYKARIDDITEKIYKEAGEKGAKINLNSPKQLAKLLYEDMGIKPLKGGKAGLSTAQEILEELSERHPICALILEYRKYQKLMSTYVEGLIPKCQKDGRIHTSFEQAVTGTGRISSREPNLQNIPVRTELGREIRRAFVAGDGYTLVDADYSQIELRVLAHMSGDLGMQGAFLRGEDIHTRTAAEVYGVDIEKVTREMRSNAKAVNFGIVYGISDFGLAKNIGVSRYEAAEFIKKYFERYPNVKKYMDEQVAIGKAQGYVSTILNRRRYLPELESSSFNMRSFGERAAMNSPIQGTAADIIKLAMVRVHRELKDRNLKSRLILQVHDELIVEAWESEKELVQEILIRGMESVMQLSVPLKAELSTGGNWNECKS